MGTVRGNATEARSYREGPAPSRPVATVTRPALRTIRVRSCSSRRRTGTAALSLLALSKAGYVGRYTARISSWRVPHCTYCLYPYSTRGSGPGATSPEGPGSCFYGTPAPKCAYFGSGLRSRGFHGEHRFAPLGPWLRPPVGGRGTMAARFAPLGAVRGRRWGRYRRARPSPRRSPSVRTGAGGPTGSGPAVVDARRGPSDGRTRALVRRRWGPLCEALLTPKRLRP